MAKIVGTAGGAWRQCEESKIVGPGVGIPSISPYYPHYHREYHGLIWANYILK